MLGFRRKNSVVKESVQEQDLNEEKNNRLEEALELTLSEVRGLRAEMTLLRKELTGAKDMEQVGEHTSETRVEEISVEEDTLEMPATVEHALEEPVPEESVVEELAVPDVIEVAAATRPAGVKLLTAAETAATSDNATEGLIQSQETQASDESQDVGGTVDLEQPTAGWATIEYRPVSRRRWWQLWKRKKEKQGQGNPDFA